jgi:hypothetical protein
LKGVNKKEKMTITCPENSSVCDTMDGAGAGLT